jgi:carboxyl-terminal processing protease
MARKLLIVFLVFVWVITGAGGSYASGDISEAEKTVSEVFEYIKEYHIDNPTIEQLKEGAIQGMIDTLDDPYTEYLDKEELSRFTGDLDGGYNGVGLFLEGQPDYPKVVEVFPGSPSIEAGIMVGDIIKNVDGIDIKGCSLSSVVEKIKGPAGTEVTLLVGRGDKEFSVSLIRASLSIPTVESKIIDGDTGYINIKSFGIKTPGEFRNSLSNLLSEHVGGLVVDIRDNPGGYFEAALEIAEVFLEKNSPVVIIRNSDGTVDRYLAERDGEAVKIPTVVLVNSYSASSSEILAGALQDNGIAVVVGERTYGKGVVQNLIMLEAGGALKVTTAEYTTPKGRRLNNKGLEPDLEVQTRELQLPFARRILKPQREQVIFTPGSSRVMVGSDEVTAGNMPFIKGQTAYLPLRFAAEALGCTVSWDMETSSIVIKGKNILMIIPLEGNPLLNGKEIAAARVYVEKGTSFIPVDLVQLMGFNCKTEKNQIIIESEQVFW